jgi:hypothetical protein
MFHLKAQRSFIINLVYQSKTMATIYRFEELEGRLENNKQ